MKNLLLFISLFITSTNFAQKYVAQREDTVYSQADKMPKFKGGDMEMGDFIQKNIVYPVAVNKMNHPVKSYMSFIVEKDGSLTGFRVLKAALNCPTCDAEALKVIKLMPKWSPGEQDNMAVRVQICLPIKFYPK